MRRLTDAATDLDSDERNPLELGIHDIARRADALGTLALVLLNKSIDVYNRRQAQLQQTKTLLGALMLLWIGACFGLKPALSKLYFADIGNPVGVAFYTMTLTAIIITGVALLSRSRWPALTWRLVGFCATWALLTPLVPQMLLFWVAPHVSGVAIAIIMSVEAFFVFAITGAIGLESTDIRRLLGLALGVTGILLIFLVTMNAVAVMLRRRFERRW